MSERFARVSSFAVAIALLAGVRPRQPPQPPATPPLRRRRRRCGPATPASACRSTAATPPRPTSTLSFEATRDPKTRQCLEVQGALPARRRPTATLAVDRLLLDGRNERTLRDARLRLRQLQFLEDEFKEIDYLVAPSGGIGYKLVATPDTTLQRRRRPRREVREESRASTAAPTPSSPASDKFEHKLSTTATITQSFGALWKAQDFGDALYTFTAGVAAALTTRTQLKIELLDTYASRPPTADVKSNDVALLTALVYKF